MVQQDLMVFMTMTAITSDGMPTVREAEVAAGVADTYVYTIAD
jgi:hypothetical protein